MTHCLQIKANKGGLDLIINNQILLSYQSGFKLVHIPDSVLIYYYLAWNPIMEPWVIQHQFMGLIQSSVSGSKDMCKSKGGVVVGGEISQVHNLGNQKAQGGGAQAFNTTFSWQTTSPATLQTNVSKSVKMVHRKQQKTRNPVDLRLI